jgi:hypothetical protein
LPKLACVRDGTILRFRCCVASECAALLEDEMGKGLLLWLIGIPLPIILVIWLFGGLH